MSNNKTKETSKVNNKKKVANKQTKDKERSYNTNTTISGETKEIKMLNAMEIKMLSEAIEVKRAALKRAANTEKDETIRQIRQNQEADYANLQSKIMSKELFNETPIGKQGK